MCPKGYSGETSEEQPEPETIKKPEPHKSGGKQDDLNPLDLFPNQTNKPK